MSALANKNRNWGDDEEDEEQKPIHDNGIVERVKVSTNAKGQKIKTITKVRVKEIRTKIPIRCLERVNLPRFGEAKVGEENVTLNSKDFVKFEHPDDAMNEVEDDTAKKTLQQFIAKQAESKFARENDLELTNEFDRGEIKFGNDDGGRGESTGRYVPPSARQGSSGPSAGSDSFRGGGGDRDGTENTLRVSNLTKAVTEDDLRVLFERFGKIHRISLPRSERVDEYGEIFKEPRGFAYIAFAHKDDAEEAMARLNGHGYDHLILKVEFSQPKGPDNGGPGGSGVGGSYMSGYGQKLAQDTKEKVSYASNLTANR